VAKVPTDNIAGRLHNLLAAGRKANRREPIHKIWTELLGVAGRPDLLLRRLARIVEMPHRLEADLRDALHGDEDAIELHLRWRHPVESMIRTMNMDNPWEQAIHHISETTLLSLETCAALLHRWRPDPSPDAAVVANLRSDVEAAIAEIEAANISNLTRVELLSHLRAVLDAMDESGFFGTRAVQEAASAAFGSILFAKIGTAERDWSAIKRAATCAWRVGFYLKTLVDFAELPERIVHMLGSDEVVLSTDQPTPDEVSQESSAKTLPRVQ
jgi:hypothetical protein